MRGEGQRSEVACRVLGGVAIRFLRVENPPTLGTLNPPCVADRSYPPASANSPVGRIERRGCTLRLGYGIRVGHNAVVMLMRRAGLAGLSGSRGPRRRRIRPLQPVPLALLTRRMVGRLGPVFPNTPHKTASAAGFGSCGRTSHSSAHNPGPWLRTKDGDPRPAADEHTPRPHRTDPAPPTSVPRHPLTRQVSPYCSSVSSQMAGNSRDRPSPPLQRVYFHVFLLCQHQRWGSLSSLPNLTVSSLERTPGICRHRVGIFSDRDWVISLIVNTGTTRWCAHETSRSRPEREPRPQTAANQTPGHTRGPGRPELRPPSAGPIMGDRRDRAPDQRRQGVLRGRPRRVQPPRRRLVHRPLRHRRAGHLRPGYGYQQPPTGTGDGHTLGPRHPLHLLGVHGPGSAVRARSLDRCQSGTVLITR